MTNSLIIKTIDLSKDNLFGYKEWLRSLPNTPSSVPIFNDGKERASILLAEILKRSTDHVYIYSHCLNEEITSTDLYYNSLKDCLMRGVKVRVLLQEDIESQSRSLIESYGGNESVKVIDVLSQKKIAESINSDFHFTVADSKLFRLEYDPSQFKAVASFYGEEISKDLESAFLSIK